MLDLKIANISKYHHITITKRICTQQNDQPLNMIKVLCATKAIFIYLFYFFFSTFLKTEMFRSANKINKNGVNEQLAMMKTSKDDAHHMY